MKNSNVGLLNELLLNMRRLADNLEESFKKEDFDSVLKIKREIMELQKKVGELL